MLTQYQIDSPKNQSRLQQWLRTRRFKKLIYRHHVSRTRDLKLGSIDGRMSIVQQETTENG